METDDEENIGLNKIMRNYEDIKEIPPNYEDIMPENESMVFSHFPNFKIKIEPGLNSRDSYVEIFKHMPISAKTKSKKNKESQNVFMQKDYKIQVGRNNDNYDNNKLLLIQEKYDQATKDIALLYDEYEKVNLQLKFLINQYQYIISNYNLNERNKKLKLVEFMNEYAIQFSAELEKFRLLEIDFFYLNELKNEFCRFLKLRYEIIQNYIIESRSLKDIIGDINIK